MIKGEIGHGDRHAQRKTVRTETHRSRKWSDTANRLRRPANRQKPGTENRLSSQPSKGQTQRTPWFWTSGLSNCETINFCYFKPRFSVPCFGSPRKLIQLIFKKMTTVSYNQTFLIQQDIEDNGENEHSFDPEWRKIRAKENVHYTLGEKSKLQINLQIYLVGGKWRKNTIPCLYMHRRWLITQMHTNSYMQFILENSL